MADDAGSAWWRDAGIAAGLVAAKLIVRAFEARMLARTAAPGMVLVRSEPNGSVRMSRAPCQPASLGCLPCYCGTALRQAEALDRWLKLAKRA